MTQESSETSSHKKAKTQTEEILQAVYWLKDHVGSLTLEQALLLKKLLISLDTEINSLAAKLTTPLWDMEQTKSQDTHDTAGSEAIYNVDYF